MKTTKKGRKLATRRPANTPSPKKIIHNTDKKEADAVEKLADTHFIVDREWGSRKKSKGADEEL